MNTILLFMNVVDIYSHCISLHLYNFHLVYYISISIRKYTRAHTHTHTHTHTHDIFMCLIAFKLLRVNIRFILSINLIFRIITTIKNS